MSDLDGSKIDIAHVEPIAPRPFKQQPQQTYIRQILTVTAGFFAVVAFGFGMSTSADFLQRHFSAWSSSAFASDGVPACSDPAVTDVIVDDFNNRVRQLGRTLPAFSNNWKIKLSNTREEFYNKLSKSRRCIADIQHINPPEGNKSLLFFAISPDLLCNPRYVYEIKYNKNKDTYDVTWECSL